jgi:hypothetical protein
MPARLAQQEDEKGMMEAAVSASFANPDGAPRLHPRYFLGSILNQLPDFFQEERQQEK